MRIGFGNLLGVCIDRGGFNAESLLGHMTRRTSYSDSQFSFLLPTLWAYRGVWETYVWGQAPVKFINLN